MELSDKEIEFVQSIDSEFGILRKFLSSEEIKMANLLVKKGVLTKGISDEKNGTVNYSLDYLGHKIRR